MTYQGLATLYDNFTLKEGKVSILRTIYSIFLRPIHFYPRVISKIPFQKYTLENTSRKVNQHI